MKLRIWRRRMAVCLEYRRYIIYRYEFSTFRSCDILKSFIQHPHRSRRIIFSLSIYIYIRKKNKRKWRIVFYPQHVCYVFFFVVILIPYLKPFIKYVLSVVFQVSRTAQNSRREISLIKTPQYQRRTAMFSTIYQKRETVKPVSCSSMSNLYDTAWYCIHSCVQSHCLLSFSLCTENVLHNSPSYYIRYWLTDRSLASRLRLPYELFVIFRSGVSHKNPVEEEGIFYMPYPVLSLRLSPSREQDDATR